MVVGVGGRDRRRPRWSGSPSCSATSRPARPGSPTPAERARRTAASSCSRSSPTRRTLPRRRASYPIGHPDRYVVEHAPRRARRRHVLAALHRGARAARARVLRLRDDPGLHATRGRCSPRPASTSSASTRRSRRSSASAARSRGARAGGGAREGEGVREGTLRPLARDARRDDHVRAAPRGARRTRRPEPAEVLAGHRRRHR